jgi:superfamily II DNA or RNA helicase
MSLWPHQERGLAALEDAMNRGVKRLLFTSPTGGGKTKVMIALLQMGFKSVVYSHRKLLREQLEGVLTDAGLRFGVRAAGVDPAFLRDIQLSSLQTENSWVLNQKRRELHDASLVLIDEAHDNKADVASEIIQRHIDAGATVVGFTATPLDLGGLYDELIVAGNNTELRECGALLPCTVYAPNEPHAPKVKPTVDGRYTEKAVEGAMKRMTLHGKVFEWWKKLNPDALPAIGFACSVETSLGWAKDFHKRGVAAAHIDGNDIWINGEYYFADSEARAQVLDESRSGGVKVVWNRYVMREGIDCPWFYHGILATIFGSLTAYLQSVGRLLRNFPAYDHVCLAKGTPILTDRGLVPIEFVKLTDRIWDGIEFVSHKGAVCNGIRQVISINGLTATPNHKVHTDDGWKTLQEAVDCRRWITRSAIGGAAIRVHDNSDPYRCRSWRPPLSRSPLRRLRMLVNDKIPQARQARTPWLSGVLKAIRGALSGMGLSQGPASVAAVQRPEGYFLQVLRCAWDSLSLRISLRSCMLDSDQPWIAGGPQPHDRPDRNGRPLRAWQSSLGNIERTKREQASVYKTKLSTATIRSCLSRRKILPFISRLAVLAGSLCRRDSSSMAQTAEVWDILDAGPRHRFTAAGYLVGNCLQDHGGNWWRHGSPNSDRVWELGDTSRVLHMRRERRLREKKDAEPIVCPNCKGLREYGRECPHCGHISRRRARYLVQSDGTLVETQGDIFKPRRLAEKKPSNVAAWERCYWRCCKTNKSFLQAEALYAKENGWRWPREDFPLMPTRELDWFERVCDVPMHRLTAKGKEQQSAIALDI